MTKKNKTGMAHAVPTNVLDQIAQSLKPALKDPVIYRRNERPPIVTSTSTCRSRFSSHGIRLIGELAFKLGQESRHPQALRAVTSDVPGYLLFEPVQIYDSNARDQYEVSWEGGYKRASLELRPLLQPRNLEAPQGFVYEMPLSLQVLRTGQSYLFVHTGEAKIRPEGEAQEEEQPAAGPVTPASQAAAGKAE